MARIRTIKPEFWTSEQVVECSPIARLMFIGMWNFCDDGGNHPASYKTLKMEVFPGDEINISHIEGYTNELLRNNLIVEYEGGNGRAYWHVTGWHHQKIDKANPKHPSFDPSKVKKFDSHSTTDQQPFDDHSPLEGKGMEGNVREEEHKEEKEKKEDTQSEDCSVSSKPSFFDLFWSAYPKKVAKEDAKRAFKKIKNPSEVIDQIINAIAWQSLSEQWRKGVIPNPATYLNGKRWHDERPPGNVLYQERRDDFRKQKFDAFNYINGGDGYGNKREQEIRTIDIEGELVDENEIRKIGNTTPF